MIPPVIYPAPANYCQEAKYIGSYELLASGVLLPFIYPSALKTLDTELTPQFDKSIAPEYGIVANLVESIYRCTYLNALLMHPSKASSDNSKSIKLPVNLSFNSSR